MQPEVVAVLKANQRRGEVAHVSAAGSSHQERGSGRALVSHVRICDGLPPTWRGPYDRQCSCRCHRAETCCNSLEGDFVKTFLQQSLKTELDVRLCGRFARVPQLTTQGSQWELVRAVCKRTPCSHRALGR